MEMRALGKTGLRVSLLGFGCGDVGGQLPQHELQGLYTTGRGSYANDVTTIQGASCSSRPIHETLQ